MVWSRTRYFAVASSELKHTPARRKRGSARRSGWSRSRLFGVNEQGADYGASAAAASGDGLGDERLQSATHGVQLLHVRAQGDVLFLGDRARLAPVAPIGELDQGLHFGEREP